MIDTAMSVTARWRLPDRRLILVPGGVLPPFPVQTEEVNGLTKQCTKAIDFRISPERIILLDTQVQISTPHSAPEV